ncbi:MAG: iron chelate uptake ABC transporter family permease subunit [Pirellulaceae bacterium]|nr:iron chelate uptake ABC transporter family permease subunit [Pirellulaceae bacterium]
MLGLKYNTLIVLAGVSLLGASAGMIGSFAVLRRRALTGDALSHAALPGICVAYLILRERNLPAMLLGALASGVVGIMVISALCRWTRIREDAAIGSVLGVFFGLGIALSRIIQGLEGGGAKAGLDSYIFGKTAGMTRGDVELILIAALAGLAVVVLGYKQFLSISFDADFARSLGWPVYRLDLLLMSLVAVAVVVGVPAVGVVLISALLIMPGAAARFWTDRLATLLIVAGLFGFAIGLVGTALSATFLVLPAGPIIVLTGTALFLVSLLFGTRRGLVARVIEQRRFEGTLGLRRLLRAAWETRTSAGNARFSRDDLQARLAWPTRKLAVLLNRATIGGHLRPVGAGHYALTSAGEVEALAVVRGHRLWEAFLTAYPEQASGAANLASLSIDEYVSPAIAQELTAELKLAGRWPEGAT